MPLLKLLRSTGRVRKIIQMRKVFSLFLLLVALRCSPLPAATISHSITPTEFDRMLEILGYGGVTRLMRSADAYPSFPGFKLGVEIALTPTRGINDMGDGTGTLPGMILAPRIYMAKGLFSNLEIIFSFFSNKFLDSLTSIGSILKYTFYSERTNFVSAALFMGYTSSSGFETTWKGSNIEFGAYFSKDYVRLKPFLGASLLFAHGEIPVAYAIDKNSGWQSTVHFFLGLEFDFPLNITVQLDMMNLAPSGTLLLGRRF